MDLDLSNNFMNGTLPTELGSLTGVQSLNLGSTMDLTKYWTQTSWSTIPSQFGMLTALTGGLDLSNNWFTGSLPSELGKLTLIDGSLEMDNNRLTGTIPRDLYQLSSLKRLELQYNLLEGPVPQIFKQLSKLQRMNFYINLIHLLTL